MNIDYQKNRELMVENQLRPNKINDPILLNLFREIPKEVFLSKENDKIAYFDIDIPLVSNRGYLKTLHIAQLIHHSEIKNNHKVLHIGSLTGYVTCILANICKKVVAIETDNQLNTILKNNLRNLEVDNVKIVNGSFKDGYEVDGPYDRIIIDLPINKVENKILDQLNPNLGTLLMIQKEKYDLNHAIKVTRDVNNYSKEYLFDVFSKYQLYKDIERFEF